MNSSSKISSTNKSENKYPRNKINFALNNFFPKDNNINNNKIFESCEDKEIKDLNNNKENLSEFIKITNSFTNIKDNQNENNSNQKSSNNNINFNKNNNSYYNMNIEKKINVNNSGKKFNNYSNINNTNNNLNKGNKKANSVSKKNRIINSFLSKNPCFGKNNNSIKNKTFKEKYDNGSIISFGKNYNRNYTELIIKNNQSESDENIKNRPYSSDKESKDVIINCKKHNVVTGSVNIKIQVNKNQNKAHNQCKNDKKTNDNQTVPIFDISNFQKRASDLFNKYFDFYCIIHQNPNNKNSAKK